MDDPGRKARVALEGNGAQRAADGRPQLAPRRGLRPLPASLPAAEAVERAAEAPTHHMLKHWRRAYTLVQRCKDKGQIV